MIKTMRRVYILVMIGWLSVAGYAKQKADAPPVPPEGMVLIPAGEFQMGSNDPEALNDEQPVHAVYIDAFFMDTHEVTNAQYKEFVEANPQWDKDRIDKEFRDSNYLQHWTGNDYPHGTANHPVTYVSWYAAMAYAKWAGKRLLTEAEWEYAARGGLIGKKYPWGDSIDSSKMDYKNDVGKTTPVGSYPPNGYGLYDMVGNVWEWCLDEYDLDFYARSPRSNPVAGGTIISITHNFTNVTNFETVRVLRGGFWGFDHIFQTVASRYWLHPPISGSSFEFRCVMAQ